MVGRNTVLIKGVAARLGLKWSLAKEWVPIAKRLLFEDENGGGDEAAAKGGDRRHSHPSQGLGDDRRRAARGRSRGRALGVGLEEEEEEEEARGGWAVGGRMAGSARAAVRLRRRQALAWGRRRGSDVALRLPGKLSSSYWAAPPESLSSPLPCCRSFLQVLLLLLLLFSVLSSPAPRLTFLPSSVASAPNTILAALLCALNATALGRCCCCCCCCRCCCPSPGPVRRRVASAVLRAVEAREARREARESSDRRGSKQTRN